MVFKKVKILNLQNIFAFLAEFGHLQALTAPPGVEGESHDLVPGLLKVEDQLGEKHPGLVAGLQHVDVAGLGEEHVGVGHHDNGIICHLVPGGQQLSQGSAGRDIRTGAVRSRGGTY